MAMILILGFLALTGIAFGQALFPDCINGPLANNTVCDTKAEPYARATALVSLFTFAEKVNNSGNAGAGVPRIGLPAYQWWSEALHGVANSPGVHFASSGNYSYATSFPQPITMGAAFDDELIHSVASVVSTEARAFNNGNRGGLNYWTPNINPYKDPRWGRGQETPGEDPFHLSSYVNQLVMGLQGELDPQPYVRVVATCKHYAGYDLEDWDGNERYGFDAIITAQDLREYYLPSFQQCARDSNVQSVMCSYNAVNGVPTCADDYLLQTILREYWGWNDGAQWVTSDCDAIHNIYDAHNYTKTSEEAVADALNAGTDLDCGTFSQLHLGAAYNQSLFNISTLDRSLIRRYASMVRLGYFDPPSVQPYRQLAFSDVSTKSSQDLALEAAQKGLVLLKNDGSFPLSKEIKTVALVGPLAPATSQMQGNYQGVAPYLVSPCAAAAKIWNATTCTEGIALNNADLVGIPGALASASVADAIIYVGGIDNTIESEGHDRDDITWPGEQLNLIGQLANLGKPLIVVQMGTQVDSSALVSNAGVNALLWAGYPGQNGGTAIVNIISGRTAPSGRLPVTQYPAGYVNEVPMTDMNLRPSNSSNPGRTYKWYTGKPVYEFGHGLHYTNFTASIQTPVKSTYEISTLLTNATAGGSNKKSSLRDLIPLTTVPVTVSNTGSVTSDYVALGFLAGSFGPEPYPKKSLVAYTRLHKIAAGDKQTGSLKLTLGSLGRVNEEGDLVLYPGDYSLVVDVDRKAEWNFTLTGESVVLDAWPKKSA